MAKRRKPLSRKYRIRRMMLLAYSAVLVVSVGWTVGKQVGKLATNFTIKDVSDESQENSTLLAAVTPPDVKLNTSAGQSVLPEISDKEDIPTQKVFLSNNESWALLLVNYANPMPEAYPMELERVGGPHSLDIRITIPFKQMVAKAKEEGINLELVSSYRDAGEQEAYYEQELAYLIDQGFSESDAINKLEKRVAQPNFSEHQTGLAVDILTQDVTMENTDFDKTAAFQWLCENAGDYGFVLRYPKGKTGVTHMEYQPWHFRYVGVDAAKEMWEKDFTLEEYLYVKEKNTKKATSKDEKETELKDVEESEILEPETSGSDELLEP